MLNKMEKAPKINSSSKEGAIGYDGSITRELNLDNSDKQAILYIPLIL